MKTRNHQSGFSAFEVVLVLAVVGIIGFVAYTMYIRKPTPTANNPATQTSVQSPTANDVKSAPEINTVSDLDTALAVLDETDPGNSNNSDARQLDTQLAEF